MPFADRFQALTERFEQFDRIRDQYEDAMRKLEYARITRDRFQGTLQKYNDRLDGIRQDKAGLNRQLQASDRLNSNSSDSTY